MLPIVMQNYTSRRETVSSEQWKWKKNKMFPNVLVTFLASRQENYVTKRTNAWLRSISVFSENQTKKSLKNSNKFSTFLQTLYNFQRRRWPTFLHGLTCSTVAVRRRSSLGGGRTLLSPMRHGGRGRARERGEKLGALTRTSFHNRRPKSAEWAHFGARLMDQIDFSQNVLI